ncbi:hypothetical protein WN093_12080 [Gammaproteobacteria bacterium AS21]
MHIVKHTLQARDKESKEIIYYLASNTPQKLPADLAKEAVARGYAMKAVDIKAVAAKSKDSDKDE